jgi:hypothetical protein
MNKKSRYDISVIAIHPPPWQHVKSRLSKSDISKGNSAQASLSPDQKILVFHPDDSLRSQNNAFNKVIVRHNKLRPHFGFSP